MSEDGLSAKGWCERFAELAGEDAPTAEEFERVLALAAEAAHASQRQAAPVACWIAGRAGLSLDEAIEIAKRVTA